MKTCEVLFSRGSLNGNISANYKIFEIKNEKFINGKFYNKKQKKYIDDKYYYPRYVNGNTIFNGMTNIIKLKMLLNLSNSNLSFLMKFVLIDEFDKVCDCIYIACHCKKNYYSFPTGYNINEFKYNYDNEVTFYIGSKKPLKAKELVLLVEILPNNNDYNKGIYYSAFLDPDSYEII